jgi:hypothetical protein
VRPLRALPIIALLVLAAAPAAQAGMVTFGSDLSAAAAIAHNKPNDAVYFNDAMASGGAVEVNVTGQVVEVQMKGMLAPSSQTLADPANHAPFSTIHFQVLRPASGKWSVPDGGTSMDYAMPWSGDEQQINTWHTTGKYDALCVKPGDRLDFATLGGFDYDSGYNDGTPFKVFGRVPGSRVLQINAEGTAGINNGHTYPVHETHDGEELLMRYVVATGADARYACQDPATQKVGSGSTTPKKTHVTLPPKQRPRLTRAGVLSVAGFCHAASSCRGKLTLVAKGKAIATKSYTVAGNRTAGIKVRFNKTGRKLFKKSHKRLKVTMTAVTDPGGPANTDALTIVVTSRS